MNQSSPRWLCREGGGFGATGRGSGTMLPSAERLGRSPSSRAIEWNGRATSSRLLLMVEFPGRQLAGRAEHDDRRILLVFGRGADLILGQLQRDAVALVGDRTEPQRE